MLPSHAVNPAERKRANEEFQELEDEEDIQDEEI